jgi:hypothetical protein
MNRARSHRIAIGLLFGTLAAAGLGIAAMSGISSFPTGDLAVSSTTWASNVLLALGAALMLGSDLIRGRRRWPTRAEQPAPLGSEPRTWMP